MSRHLILLLSAVFMAAVPVIAAGEESAEAAKETIYVSMHPHFLTNLADHKRFVQIKAQALVSNEATQTALQLHMPAVRHELLMLLGDMQPDDLKGVAAKQAFLDNAVTIMRETLTRHRAEASDVEGMFITSMVIQ